MIHELTQGDDRAHESHEPPGAFNDLEFCRAFIEHHCIYRSPPGQLNITSADYGTNAWQFYMPIAVLDQEFAERIGRLFWRGWGDDGIQFCGCESGGSLLASVLQQQGKFLGHDVPAFMIKKAAKSYGLGNWLEGVVDPDLPVLLVDDVVGSGKTLASQARRLKEFGLNVIGAWCIASCKLTSPYLSQAPIDLLFRPSDFARLHTEYTRHYNKEPEFWGTVV